MAGISYERALSLAALSEQNLGIDDIYALQLNTEYTQSDGTIRTDSLSRFTMLFGHSSESTAHVHNMNTQISYYLIKKANTVEEWRSNQQIENPPEQSNNQPVEEPVVEPVEEPVEQPVETPSN